MRCNGNTGVQPVHCHQLRKGRRQARPSRRYALHCLKQYTRQWTHMVPLKLADCWPSCLNRFSRVQPRQLQVSTRLSAARAGATSALVTQCTSSRVAQCTSSRVAQWIRCGNDDKDFVVSLSCMADDVRADNYARVAMAVHSALCAC